MFLSNALVGLTLASTAAFAAVIDVTVGGPSGTDLFFSPEAVSAQPGDTVVYHFNPKNHSVVQSSFASPCGALEGGINSGFFPVAIGTTGENLPTYTVTVSDTNPIWIHCAQTAPSSHCGAGMVHAINCGPEGSPNSFSAFKAAALAFGAASSSGDPYAPAPSTTYTAAYGTATVPAPLAVVTVTETVTFGADVWTTTYGSYPGSPDPTPAAADASIHTVIVGGTGVNLTFTPNQISAQPRDTVIFEFHQKNHTVTQSSFEGPCVRLKDAAGTVTGFDSGFQPVADNATEFPTFSITVNDTAPIWAYCRQRTPVSHCGTGMVFAINSNEASPRSFAAFQALAQQLNGTSTSSSGGSPDPTGATGDQDDAGVVNGVTSLGLFVAIATAIVGSLL